MFNVKRNNDVKNYIFIQESAIKNGPFKYRIVLPLKNKKTRLKKKKMPGSRGRRD